VNQLIVSLRADIELGGCMQVAFEHSTSKKAEADYAAFLKIDTQLEALLADLPPWLRPSGDTTGMPPACVEVSTGANLLKSYADGDATDHAVDLPRLSAAQDPLHPPSLPGSS
jgi:hypothetical protein